MLLSMDSVLKILKTIYKENYIKIDLDNGESLKIPIKIFCEC